MKLVNPTDSELDAAFAEKVAGWRKRFGPWANGRERGSWRWETSKYRVIPGYRDRTPSFTRSMDAVLPWLKECYCDITRQLGEEGFPETWSVKVFTGAPDGEGEATDDDSLPRAAVIALLRANGIEVQFT